MSAMADYEIWLEERGRADSEESRAAYLAEVLGEPHTWHDAGFGGQDITIEAEEEGQS